MRAQDWIEALPELMRPALGLGPLDPAARRADGSAPRDRASAEAQIASHPKRAMELAPPIRVIRTSNRRWEEDEFMIPQALTEGRERVRLRLEFMPVKLPLFPGHPVAEEAWTEYRYQAYCFVMPRPADSGN